jgi:DNA-binding CsgD family transcriptional regulator
MRTQNRTWQCCHMPEKVCSGNIAAFGSQAGSHRVGNAGTSCRVQLIENPAGLPRHILVAAPATEVLRLAILRREDVGLEVGNSTCTKAIRRATIDKTLRISHAGMSRLKKQDPDDLILKIHAAPLEPRGWHSIARHLLELCDAEKSLMVTIGLAPEKFKDRSLNFSPSSLADYATHWVSEDLLYLGAVKQGRVRPGLVSTDRELVDRRDYTTSAYFNEYMKPNDLDPALNLCLTQAMPELGLGPSAITLFRGFGREPFEAHHKAVLQQLAPHLATAARASWRIEALSMREPILRRALDEVKLPLFGLDQSGHVWLVNSAADHLLRSNRWVTAVGGTLAASSRLLKQDAFRRTLAKLRTGVGSTMLLTDGGSRAQAVMTTVPVGDASSSQIAHKKITGFVWIVPCAPQVAPVESLGQLFELTPAEMRLLQHLAEGASLNETASVLKLSSSTVRTQLKSIFRKTGQRSQGRLLALAQRIAIIRDD